ncbi:MAG: hypothetical protein LUH14_04045, partial [Clostridiaceae bacterium]|nr:hypothetical protein [Clostridiaceae bacterium]
VQTYGRECPDPVDKTDQTYTKNNITKISCKNFITKISIFSSSCSESQKEILSVIRNAVEWLSRKSPHDIVAKYSVQEILNHCNMLSDQEIRQVMSYMQSKKVTSKAGIVTALMNADYYLKLAQVSGCGIEENTDKKNRFHCERAYSRAELNDLEKILVCGKEPQTYDDG